jgi:protein TonB
MLQLQTAHRAYAPRPPRTAGIVFITVLHTAAIYAFLTALDFIPKPPVPSVLEWRTIVEENKEPPLLPPEIPAVPVPEPVVVPPAIELRLDPPPSQTALVLPPPLPPVTPPMPVDPPVTIAPARAIASTHTIPEYPILSRRLGEQGSVHLSLTVGADGMVAEAKVLRSSGFPRLDAAAIDWVLRYWRYQPAMRGAMPVASMAEAIMQFRLDR